MSINLADYAELLEDPCPPQPGGVARQLARGHQGLLPRGLDNYLKGVSAIRGLGRGDSLVETWIGSAAWWPRRSARTWWAISPPPP
jgi:nitric oxide reductase NorD protein